MPGDSIRVTLLATDVLEKLGIPYAIGGSLSSSVHGVMRATLDADIVADLRLEHKPAFIAALSPAFYADDEMIRDAILHRSSFNLIHYDTAFKVDIFIPKDRNFDRLQLQRRSASVITTDPERHVFVISPEDVILSKLEWYRLGGEVSDRQWRDILGVIKTKSRHLDIDYLHRMAKELKVEDLLDRALSED
ncbi:MAG: hypothetical protein A2Z16_12045 [Chloroflexi bacterium RBG_16_54_18]|nr:MAG: hypothetical protein A2Z16_12045 [Chloroflexi bacterium RBG_16_54_18]